MPDTLKISTMRVKSQNGSFLLVLERLLCKDGVWLIDLMLCCTFSLPATHMPTLKDKYYCCHLSQAFMLDEEHRVKHGKISA